MKGFRTKSFAPGKKAEQERTDQAISLDTTGPRFSVDDPTAQTSIPTGRSIDGEEERLQRFLNQMRCRFRLSPTPPEEGRAAVDFYVALRDKAPMLRPEAQEQVAPLLTLARQQKCKVQVIVWASTPGERACELATLRAARLCDELCACGGYDGLMRSRMVAVGRPWMYRDLRRPAFSLVLLREGER
jgi:hypothetical protein